MKKQSAKKKLQNIRFKIIPLLKESEVIRCAFFGSYATGSQKKNSDIDILVDLPKTKSLFDLIELKMKLEEKLGKKVDVVTYRSLSPLLKEHILKEQISIYEKRS